MGPAQRRPDDLLSSRLVRWGIGAWSAIGLAVLAYLIWRYLLYPVRVAVGPLAVALVLVYLLNPVVSRLERHGIPRAWATILTYLVFLVAIGFAARLLVPMLVRQVSSFVEAVPSLLAKAQDSLTRLADRLGVAAAGRDLVSSFDPGGVAGDFIGRIFSVTASVLHLVVVTILGIVLSVYLLIDLPKAQQGAWALIPKRYHQEIGSMIGRIGRALGGYFRGQLLVALFVGLASMLGLWIVGLPYWALIGAIAGLFNLIPLIGPFIGAVPALFIAFTTDVSEGLLSLRPGWALALGATIALTIVQQTDNHIISPNVMARTVKLHPVTVMLGLLVAGTLAGLVGMLLAVPAIATAKIILLFLWDRQSRWPPPGEGGGKGVGGEARSREGTLVPYEGE